MPEKPTEAQPGLNVADIYYLIFRHKWKLVVCALLGCVAAAVVFAVAPRNYISNAKILVRYVAETAPLNPANKEDRVKTPDYTGQTILSSELEIITSRDLAEEVATRIGAETLLARAGGGTNWNRAVGLIGKGLKAQVLPKTSIIAVSFQHPDPDVARPVLELLVERYREKHMEIHRAVGAYDFLQRQTDDLRARLSGTEQELRRLRTNAGIISFDEAKKSVMADMAQLRTDIAGAEMELETSKAALKEREKWMNPATNAVSPVEIQTPARQVSLYKSVTDRLDALKVKEVELLATFTEINPAVQNLRAQVTELDRQRLEMEKANPELALAARNSSPSGAPKADLTADATQVALLDAKVRVLKAQWEKVRAEAVSLDSVENTIKDAERRKEMDELNLRYFSANLEKVRIDQQLEASKISNISVVQSASLAGLHTEPLYKPVGIALAAGVALGVLLALFSEFILNPSVKRPVDFQKRLRMPLLLTIPDLKRSIRRGRLPAVAPSGANGHAPVLQPTIWDGAHPMRPYLEALRDRMLVAFAGDPRRPKLVGVTACSKGAGCSTTAAGLAAALSETGDGNVLLVDLNMEHGAAHEFFRGKPGCGLNDAVEDGKRQQGQLQENLFLARLDQVNGNGPDGLSKVPSRKIAEFMPRLRASDYDYIIFDMPPITQTSATFRMAGLMDKVLMVVESEKTHVAALQQAQALLLQARAQVHAVLNRHRQYVPRVLQQDLEGSDTE